MTDGITNTLSTNGSVFHVNAGAAMFYGESGEISGIKNLSSIRKSVKSFTTSQLVVNDDVGTYPISANVVVYSRDSGSFKLSDMSAALEAFNNKETVSFYYDKDPDRGGCIRVIVHN
jgi:hypothetical protein